MPTKKLVNPLSKVISFGFLRLFGIAGKAVDVMG